MEFTYVTGNRAKISSAKQYLEPLGVTVNHVKMDTPELQADNVEEIAKFSAKNSRGVSVAYCDKSRPKVLFMYRLCNNVSLLNIVDLLKVDIFLFLRLDFLVDKSIFIMGARL